MNIKLPRIACVLLHGVHTAPAMELARRLFAPGEIFDMHEHAQEDLVAIVASRSAAGQMTAIVEAGSPVGAHRARVALASAARENYVRRFGLAMPDALASEPKIEARLKTDGYREVFVLDEAGMDDLRIEREPMPTDVRHERGAFDIIGDVHGCADELATLLGKLGYRVTWPSQADPATSPGLGLPSVETPPGRRIIFVGDLVDRGPRSADVLRLVLAMTRSGGALLVPGNHDMKFLRWLKGEKVAMTHGLDATVRSLEGAPPRLLVAVRDMLSALWSHLWLDEGRLAVAHAGLLEPMLGRATPRVRHFCLYGDTSGEKDANGLSIRYNWAADYSGSTAIVYGHTPVADAEWQNNTICVDTACCFGGKLTALRWPEREIVSVPALATYAQLMRPLGHPPARAAARATGHDTADRGR